MDWTIVATTGISACAGLGGALLGFVGAVRQGQSESDRLRAQHFEVERSHRQGVYHNLLDDLYAFDRMHLEKAMTEAEYREWEPRFVHHMNGVRLFGPEAVNAPAEALLRQFAGFQVALEVAATPPGETFEQRLLYHCGSIAEPWANAARELREAMRRDVELPRL